VGGVRSVATGARARAFALDLACFPADFAALGAGRLLARFRALAAFFGRFAVVPVFFLRRFLAIEIPFKSLTGLR
jgi:hypothetical protein